MKDDSNERCLTAHSHTLNKVSALILLNSPTPKQINLN